MTDTTASLREPTDEMVTAFMREFEKWTPLLRYKEADKWHVTDIMGVRHALRVALSQPPAPVAHPAPTDKEVEEQAAAIAARFTRLHGICTRILWTDYGVPAMGNEQTRSALEDLSEYLFMDGIDKAMRHSGEPQTSDRMEDE